MDKRTVLKNLRNTLAELYEDETDAKRITKQAGIDTQRIAFGSSTINRWHEILNEAEKLGKTNGLIDEALDEYKTNRNLQQAATDYRQSLQQGEDLATAEGSSAARQETVPATGHVFICYSQLDQDFVLALARQLQQHGVVVWVDQWDIAPGADWNKAVDQAIYGCTHVLVVLSPAATESREAMADLRLALDEKKPIVPVLYQACHIPRQLRLLQYVDFQNRRPDDEPTLQRLLRTMTISLRNTPVVKALGQPVSETTQQFPEPQRVQEVLQPTSMPTKPPVAGKQDKVIDDLTKIKGIGQSRTAWLRLSFNIRTFQDLAALSPDDIEAKLMAEGRKVERREIEAWITQAQQLMYGQSADPILIKAYSPPVQTKTESSINFDWVTIPAGEFLMGSDKQKDKQAPDDELPQHKVYLAEYRITRVSVTVAQFEQFVKTTGYQTTAEKQGSVRGWTGSTYEEIKGAYWARPRGPQSDVRQKAAHPVTCISWVDAMAFCQWVGMRLPSEAEWEKAARGMGGYIYPWGDEQPDESRCNFKMKMNIKDTTPVGKYPKGASPYGVLDMAGNVWEWTADWYDKNYYVNLPSYNPKGPENGQYRTLRGGAFDLDVNNVRCALRGYSPPTLRNNNVGFRVVSSGF